MNEGTVTQASLKFVIKESSMAKMAEKFGGMMNKQIENMKTSIGVGAPRGTNLQEVQKSVQSSANISESMGGAMSGTNKLLDFLIKAVAPLAIVATIMGQLTEFITPFIKLFGFVLLTSMVPVFRWLKENLGNLAKFFGFGETTKSTDLPGESNAKAVGSVGLGGIGGALGFSVGGGIGAVIGAAIGVLIANSAVEFGQWLGQGLWDYIIMPLINVGINLGIWLTNFWIDMNVKWNLFIAGLTDFVTNFPKELQYWIESNINPIMNQLLEIGQHFLDWVIERLDFILGSVNKIGSELLNWITTNINSMMSEVLGIGKIIYEFITDPEKLNNIFKPFVNFGQTLYDSLMGPDGVIIKGLSSLLNIGELIKTTILNFFSGIDLGLKNTGDNLWSMIMNAINGQPNTAVGDFIWRPGQGVASIDPNDTVFGAKGKGLEGMTGGKEGITYSPTYNVTAGIDGNYLTKIFKEHDDNLRRNILGRSSYVTNLRP